MADTTKKPSSLATLQGMSGKILGAGEELQRLSGNAGLPTPPTDAIGTAAIGGTPDQQKMAGTTAQMGAALKMAIQPRETLAYEERTAPGRVSAKDAKAQELPESLRALAGLSGKIRQATMNAITEMTKDPDANFIPQVGVMTEYIQNNIGADRRGNVQEQAEAFRNAVEKGDAAAMQEAMNQLEVLVSPDEFKRLFGADESQWRTKIMNAIPDSMTLEQILGTEVKDAFGAVVQSAMGTKDMEDLADKLLQGTTNTDIGPSAVLKMSWAEIKNRMTNYINRSYSDVNLLRQQATDLTLPTATRNAALQRLRELGAAGQVYQAQEADRLKERIERGDNILFNGEYRELEDVLSEDTVQNMLRGILSGQMTTEELKGTVYAPLIDVINNYTNELAEKYGISPSKEVSEYMAGEMYRKTKETRQRQAAWQTYQSEVAGAAKFDQLQGQLQKLGQSTDKDSIEITERLYTQLKAYREAMAANPETAWMVPDIDARLADAEKTFAAHEKNSETAMNTLMASVEQYDTLEALETAKEQTLKDAYVTDNNKEAQQELLDAISGRETEIKEGNINQWLSTNGIILDDKTALSSDPGNLQKNLDSIAAGLADPAIPEYVKERLRSEQERLTGLFNERSVSFFLEKNKFPDTQAASAPEVDDSTILSYLTSLSEKIAATPEANRGPLQAEYDRLKPIYDTKFAGDLAALQAANPDFINSIPDLNTLASERQKLKDLGAATGENKKLLETALANLDARELVIKDDSLYNWTGDAGKAKTLAELEEIVGKLSSLGSLDNLNNLQAFRDAVTARETFIKDEANTKLIGLEEYNVDYDNNLAQLPTLQAIIEDKTGLYDDAQKQRAAAAQTALKERAVEGLVGNVDALTIDTVAGKLIELQSKIAALPQDANGNPLDAELNQQLYSALSSINEKRRTLTDIGDYGDLATLNVEGANDETGNLARLTQQKEKIQQIEDLLKKAKDMPGLLDADQITELNAKLTSLRAALTPTEKKWSEQNRLNTSNKFNENMTKTFGSTAPKIYDDSGRLIDSSQAKIAAELLGLPPAINAGDPPPSSPMLTFFTAKGETDGTLKSNLESLFREASSITDPKLRSTIMSFFNAPNNYDKLRTGTASQTIQNIRNGFSVISDFQRLDGTADSNYDMIPDWKESFAAKFGLTARDMAGMDFDDAGMDLPSWIDSDNDGVIDNISADELKRRTQNLSPQEIESMQGQLDLFKNTAGLPQIIKFSKMVPKAKILDESAYAAWRTDKSLDSSNKKAMSAETHANSAKYISPIAVDAGLRAAQTSIASIDEQIAVFKEMKETLETGGNIPAALSTKYEDVKRRLKSLEDERSALGSKVTAINKKIQEQAGTNPFYMNIDTLKTTKIPRIRITRSGGIQTYYSTLEELSKLSPAAIQGANLGGKVVNMLAIYKSRAGMTLSNDDKRRLDSAYIAAASGGDYW